MKYCILFTKGVLEGKKYPLSSGATVIGRSRSAGIVVPSPDVSGRHVVIEVSDTSASLVNLSRHHTAVGLKTIPENNRVSLDPGIPVSIGRSTEFKIAVESSGPSSATVLPEDPEKKRMADSASATVLPKSPKGMCTSGADVQADVPKSADRVHATASKAGASATEIPSSIPSPDLNETQFLQTQLVSPEDIAKLIESGAKRRSWHVLMKVSLFVGLFISVAAAYYIVQIHQRPEKTLTWPLTASGKYDIRTVDLPTPFGPDAFWVECPGSPQFKVVSRENGITEIYTRVGRKRDVEYRISFQCVQKTENLHNNRRQHFDRWRREREEQNGWNFQSVSPPAFLENNSGFPYFDVQYLRTEKNASDSMQWFGHALFAVHADCVLTLSREIPAVEQWRGAALVAVEKLLRVSAKEIDGHWEGRPDARNASVKDLKDEAAGLLARKSPILWQETEFLIQSALIKCGGRGEDAERLLAMLRELRANQKHEYRQFKVAWHQANRVRDKVASQHVLENALKVFSSPDDRRNWLLKKGAW